jgi:hypothetical protein
LYKSQRKKEKEQMKKDKKQKTKAKETFLGSIEWSSLIPPAIPR